MLGKAIAIAAEAFKDKRDKSGNPYILHCLWVMDGVKHLGEDVMIAAILHDLIEDTEWTFAQLTSEGFNDKIIGILHLLTHNKETPYDEYIKAISVSKEATEIKKKDLEHNSNITRLKGLRKKDMDRIEKYHRAYIYLSN
jgi:(p)ppGpp synthase/HD superfamily hydrolase